jgi:tyrosyl-tRNA synthetase
VDLFSAYDYWQFWRNTDDRDVKRFLNFFTEIKSNEIDRLIEQEKNINNLKILLANEATKILHGESAAKNAEKTARETFLSGGIGMDLPEIKLKKKDIKNGIKILDLLSSSEIMSSKSDARRAIKSNALKIDNIILSDDTKIIKLSDFKKNILKVSFGKKKHYLIKII